jgi:predicted nucleic acid-binding protein
MKYLIDTDLLSQVTKPLPDAKTVAWLKATPRLDTAISVISLIEI